MGYALVPNPSPTEYSLASLVMSHLSKYHPVEDFFTWASIEFKASRCCCDACVAHKGPSAAREYARRLRWALSRIGRYQLSVGTLSMSQGEYDARDWKKRASGSVKRGDGAYMTDADFNKFHPDGLDAQKGACALQCPFGFCLSSPRPTNAPSRPANYC